MLRLPCLPLRRATLAVALFIGLGVALAATPAIACGNPGERACCFGETGYACVSGAIYVPQANSGLCGGFDEELRACRDRLEAHLDRLGVGLDMFQQ